MKRNILTVFLLALALFALIAGCLSLPGGTERLSEKDNGGDLHLTVGDTLIITLNANPTTGYNWEIESLNPLLLEQRGQAQFHAQSQAIGAPGKMTFTFKAIAPGTCALGLVYRRPWEKNVSPIGIFKVTLTIKE
ncbi:MAG: protease inhibitor I42 family protein [Candidatus Margulisiibacteriota bacterium]|jgi:inhibitor of cysteine peptidase